jgi:hypothetical protein
MALSDVTAQIISMQSSSRGAPLSKVLKDTVHKDWILFEREFIDIDIDFESEKF